MQVGDPRKQVNVNNAYTKKGDVNSSSPNMTLDSNRITALDDLNRVTMQRSTRADTQFMNNENSRDD